MFATPIPAKVLIKGTRIVSPFADSPETVLRAVRDCVPAATGLGSRQLTPHELRACLAREPAEGGSTGSFAA